jgi:hypothetical protein
LPKTKRGRILWKVPSRGRGTCPVCFTTRIKLLYTKTKTDGTQISVCKACSKASIDKINHSYQDVSQLSFRRDHKREFNLLAQNHLDKLTESKV